MTWTRGMDGVAALITLSLAIAAMASAQAPAPVSGTAVPASGIASSPVNPPTSATVPATVAGLSDAGLPAGVADPAASSSTPGNARTQPTTSSNATPANGFAGSHAGPPADVHVPQIPLDDPAVPVSNGYPNLPAANNPGVLQIQGMHGESVPWSIVVLLTLLTLIPSILLCATPFARLLIVFHFLRQALGLQTTPSNQTLIGLSLILTFFLMQPVGAEIYESAIVPMQSGQITAMEALGRSEVPMRKFMSHYVREKDVALFVDLSKEPRPATADDISMRVMLPAYILSELKAGFQIGTVLFLPFLIVDMVVASITTSVGMLQLPPVVISTPLKLLLFLMVDGWHLLVGSLMRSFS
jgi:flagellar biosynthetic protein FliP